MKTNPTQTIDELITALSFIIDVEEKKEFYHAWRVAILAAKFSSKVGPKKRKEIFYAALLHDVGGIGLVRHIIHFLKQENKNNRNALLSHPIIGAQLVSIIPRMNPSAKLILDHHEWFNGLGYPRGKINKYIPLGSQLIRAADSIDIAMRYKRYKKLKTARIRIMESANKEISKNISTLAINTLKKQRFFYTILNESNIPKVFYEIKEDVGQIHMAKGIDTIGRTLEVIAQIIDMKHPFTAGHSTRVARYAMAIALAMKLEHDEVTRIRWAGLIHDIGKLTVSRKILDKPTKLTKDEFMRIKQHPGVTHKMLDMIPTLKEIAPIAAGHHEYFNGSGYPLGLKAKEAIIGARILTVCDAFDAMTSNRPYRKPYTPQQACQQIRKLSGIQFDPEIVKVAIGIFKNLSA